MCAAARAAWVSDSSLAWPRFRRIVTATINAFFALIVRMICEARARARSS
jgi:hypothetical protein